MRLFIAFRLSDDVRGALEAVQLDMMRRGVRGSFTRPENLHLTLAFIGEYPDPEPVLEVLDALPFAPIPLRLEGVGAFGDLWWIGVTRADALAAYVRRLRRALADAGIPFDRKRFSPHITLVRRAVCADGMPVIVPPEAEMLAERASLMRSDRGRNGMVYNEITF